MEYPYPLHNFGLLLLQLHTLKTGICNQPPGLPTAQEGPCCWKQLKYCTRKNARHIMRWLFRYAHVWPSHGEPADPAEPSFRPYMMFQTLGEASLRWKIRSRAFASLRIRLPHSAGRSVGATGLASEVEPKLRHILGEPCKSV